MARISVVLGAVVVFLCTSFASARMYFLPDYQNGAYLKRVNDKSHADNSVFTPDLRSCADYYECGGDWQYCEGNTCSADSSMCSEYCEDDYFPYECDSKSLCRRLGVYIVMVIVLKCVKKMIVMKIWGGGYMVVVSHFN